MIKFKEWAVNNRRKSPKPILMDYLIIYCVFENAIIPVQVDRVEPRG
jgi:hypothetical protein